MAPALALVVVLVLAACSQSTAIAPLPPPPSTRPRPTTTAPPDYTGIGLPAVSSGRTTTTTLALGPGKATLNGRLLAPDGTPAASATVRVERLVGRAVASMDVTAGPDGSWSAPGVLGGSYRVRAWRAPDIAVVNPAFVFVGATDTVPVDLKLERNFGTTPKPAVAPNPPVVGDTTNLVLQVTSRSVDPGGVVQGVPMAGATVELAGGTGWGVGLPNPAVTDATGRASWELVCRGGGVQALRLVVNGTEQFQLALPACAEPPAPTTTATPTAPGVTTTRPPATTTTTHPAVTTTRPATTTSTTNAPSTTAPATTKPTRPAKP